MDISINYPANPEEWYAKGTAGEIYFEVPAVFNSDGSCDRTATYALVLDCVEAHAQQMAKLHG